MRFKGVARLFGILLCISAAGAHGQSEATEFQIVRAKELTWMPVPDGLGTEFAVVRGNPAEAGTYVIRVRFPAGVMDTPHFHSRDRHVTVIEGSWFAGVGTTFDPEAAQEITAGGYMFHPAGAAHWDGARVDRDTVVQIIGNGPVSTEQSNAGETMWVRVHD